MTDMHADPPNSLLTPQRHTAIVEAMRKGLYVTTAAAVCRVSRRTLFRWLELGERDYEAGEDTGYARLFEDVRAAEAEFEAEMVAAVRKAAKEPHNWAAAMTMLERKWPDRFGRRDTTVLEGGERPAIVVNVGDPEVRDLTRGLLRKLASTGPDLQLIEGEVVSDDEA